MNLSTSKIENRMIEELKLQFGYHTAAEVFRDGLRFLYQEKMPNVLKKKPPVLEPAPKTAEEWCQAQGGTLIIKGTEKFCKLMEGTMEVEIPVPKEFV